MEQRAYFRTSMSDAYLPVTFLPARPQVQQESRLCDDVHSSEEGEDIARAGATVCFTAKLHGTLQGK
jgi:hypothetical protein